MTIPAASQIRRFLGVLAAGGLLAVAPFACGDDGAPPAAQAVPPAGAAKPAADPDDLGRGLRYCRIADLDASDAAERLAPIATAPRPLVVDLRLARGDAANAAKLEAALRRSAGALTPRFVLVGPATAPAVRAAIPRAAGVLTIGSADGEGMVTVTVSVDPARDRAAAEALAAGRAPAALIEEKVEKRRFDEARLARAHASGTEDTDTGETPAAAGPGAPAEAKDAPPPLKDLVLERAVFLHRALLALGRLPEPAETPPAGH